MRGKVYHLYLEGEDLLGLEDLSLKDLAGLLGGLDALLQAFVQKEGIEEPFTASLVGVREGSVALEVSTSLPAYLLEDKLFDPLEKGRYADLGPQVWDYAYRLSRELMRKNRALKLERKGSVKPLLGAARPVPQPTPVLALEDTLTLYGEVIRLGGVEPKVDLRTPRGEYHVKATREAVEGLKQRLYRVVGLKVRAHLARDGKGWKVVGNPELLEVLPYEGTPPGEALRGLARLTGDAYRDVDPEEFVRRLRG